MKIKNLTTLTKALTGLGGLIILFSFAWHIAYPNKSQLMICLGEGILVLGFAYICEWTRKMRERINIVQSENKKMYVELDNVVNCLDRWVKEKLEDNNKNGH